MALEHAKPLEVIALHARDGMPISTSLIRTRLASLRLVAGSVVLVPAGELHDVHARGDQGCVLLVTIAGAND
jgi:hypothetical protein